MRKICLLLLLSYGTAVYGESTLLTNVSVCQAPGTKAPTIQILFADGIIAEIAAEVSAIDANVVDGQGGCVSSGFINSATTLGIEEVGLSTNAEDQKYEGETNTISFDPALAFNTQTSLIPLALEEGVTHAVVRGEAGKDIFAGQSQLIGLPEGLLLGKKALVVYLGEKGRGLIGKSRAAALQRLQNAFEEAALFEQNRRAYQSNRLRELGYSVADLEVLTDVLAGDLKLAIYIDRGSEIVSVLEALDEYDLDIVLMGAREAWKVASEIADRQIPVVIDVLDNRPESFDRLGARLDQAALLHQAGVKVAFMTEYLYQESRELTQSAGVAVAQGLPWQVALEAITKTPADIWGLGGGVIEVGHRADVVVWNAEPLELSSHVTHVFIAGKLQKIENRQKLLRDRYRNIDDRSTPFGYR